jgi:membrane protease YdiL (CAAX protease family)
MSPVWRGTLLHVATSLALIAIVTLVLRARRLPAREFLALRWPAARTVALWLGAFAILVVVEEWASRMLGLPAPESWGDRYTGLVLVVRLIGLVVLAPVAEELVFRGVLFGRIARTRLGQPGAVVIPAALFALLHLQYSPVEMGFVAVDGLFFGLARAQSRSLYVPMLLHASGNAVAAAQRLLA